MNNQGTEALKPCPFCGETNLVKLHYDEDCNYRVTCCGCNMIFKWHFSNTESSWDNAIRKWNTRCNQTINVNGNGNIVTGMVLNQ